MKQVYLVHCWDGTSDDGWYPWIEEELKKYNVEVVRFDMPNTNTPKIEEWINTLDSKVRELNNNIYFIGHSIGCQTIMRYLETKEITKIGGILFVAPWLDLLPEAIEDVDSYNIAYPWIHTSINFKKVREFSNNINCIFSDNDYFVSLNQEKEFRDKLNASTVVVKEKGHISQDDNVYELQEILECCKNILGVSDSYVKKFSKIPDFEKNGFFKGYYLNDRKLGIEVDYIDMMTGHEFYQIESESIHIYYILEGSGKANINGTIYDIESGDTIEIPINTEFAFKGKLKMIEIMNPPFDPNTHVDTRKNDL